MTKLFIISILLLSSAALKAQDYERKVTVEKPVLIHSIPRIFLQINTAGLRM